MSAPSCPACAGPNRVTRRAERVAMRSIVLASTPAQAGSLGYPRCVTLASACTHALAAGACVAILLVTACGATTAIVTPSSSPAASATPTAGTQPFVASGFRTDIPAGWQDQT